LPKRSDIHSILIIGSGPIVIGQACEFDYSGSQACRALKEEGYRVILINSNPATIMTDPEMADRTYVEPITPEYVEKIIARDRPDVLLPTLGGQTALNVAVELAESGVLDRYGVELIGAKLEAIKKAEDRELFQKAMRRIGVEVPRGGFARTVEEAWEVVKETGYPAIIRPAFTLGGTGGSTAFTEAEFDGAVRWGLSASPIGEILIEESVIGWKEYELEVMRDLADNVVIICSIENFDPMGIHTGDSITVAPAQTLTDKEYQAMRDAAIRIIREIGVETGGSNIQFAVSPHDGRLLAIEMNPRVSRSSALASKATGFPIAKIAAKLAVGYTLDEIPNDITRETPASFEPTIDYVVVKIPRWAFEKFPNADRRLGTQMKSVGETMAIGRTFKEALQKGLRGLEIDRYGLGADGKEPDVPALSEQEREEERERVYALLKVPTAERIFQIKTALQLGIPVEEIHRLTGIDPWFLRNLKALVDLENDIRACRGKPLPLPLLRRAKQNGFSDYQLGHLLGANERSIRAMRLAQGVRAVYKTVDTCAAEFEAMTPYYYSTYESENETRPKTRKTIMILGGGPNRIGQGIEFDYCCVQAVLALKEEGYETIMVNSNPETVSTDYDTSDRLFFEPLTFEDVMNIVEAEQPDGVIVQFGGQTPLKLAIPLERAGVPIIGTSPDSIDLAEDRKRFGALTAQLGIPHPPHGTVFSYEEAIAVARTIGYPVLVRPSYVLGGRNMAIVYDDTSLGAYMRTAVQVSPEHPILVDKFLEDAFEYDVDAIADGTDVVIGGIMEHIEEAGIHSGDSACVLPPYMVKPVHIEAMRTYTVALARALHVVGLINVQYAIKNDVVYVLEVNPRASRTIPFVSKAIGVPLAKLAARVMAGRKLKELGITREIIPHYASVKEVVLPFVKFAGTDSLLGPEMKSTGEVMGICRQPGLAFGKSQAAAGGSLPMSGAVLISVNAYDHDNVVGIARELGAMGFTLIATEGTGRTLTDAGLSIVRVNKVHEGSPHVVDYIRDRRIQLIVNTPLGKSARDDDYAIRRAAIEHGVPCITTLSAAWAAVNAIRALRDEQLEVKSLQEWHAELKYSDEG
jgi:carbamoyl-phosphate synthase large subunit